MFVLTAAGRRGLATRSVHVTAAVLGQVNDLLAGKLRAALASRLASGPGRLLAAALAVAPAAGAGSGTSGSDGANGCMDACVGV